MSKQIYFIVILIFGIFIIYAFLNEEVDVLKENIDTFNSYDENVLILAEIENELAAQKLIHIHSEANEDQDYSTLFPDLYTVYDVPDDMESEHRIAYITFDDGPSSNTFEILDILDEMNVTATFFIVGSAITQDGEDALRRMTDRKSVV